jgi:hypothetical protein
MINEKENHLIIFSSVIALTSIRLFSFILIPDRIFDIVEFLIFAIILVLYIQCLKTSLNKRTIFGLYISAIIILTLISFIPAKVFHDQSFLLSFLASRTIIYWLVFFILIKFDANDHKLEKLIVFIGIIWSLIMVMQQISFPKVMFNSPNIFFDYSSDNDIETVRKIAEERAGLIRIMILGLPYGYFLIFYSWNKLNEFFNLKSFFILVLVTVALFLTGSRQIVFAVVLILTFDFILGPYFLKTKKLFVLVFLLGFFYFIYPIINSYFSSFTNYFNSLISLTRDQNVISNDYIRIQEINFFLFSYYPHWLCYIFGNGWEHSLSSYGQEMINQVFYRGDIGLIGALNKFGLIYVIIIILIFFKVIIPQIKVSIPHYIRLLFIFLLITSLTGVNYFETEENIMLFVFVFYIIEKRSEEYCYINSNP